MDDLEMTLDPLECGKLRVWQGKRVPKTPICIFIYAETEEKLSVAISVEDDERFVVEVSKRGDKIQVIKNI